MEQKKVAVVGAGLVGCLQTCFLAQRGFTVYLYEKREDIRLMEHVPGRSINLALSYRGRSALAAIGMEETILEKAIPMYARMIHDLDGRQWSYPYGTPDQYINSVDRRKLNEVLLTKAETYPNVTINFHHKIVSCNFDKNEITFSSDGKTVKQTVDLICACDGAYSVLRQEMLKRVRLNFSQEYIPHGYVEISMPPKLSDNGTEFAMAVNYLHIWPRNEFMMIGLPNLDKSFTGTLFMPFEKFEALKTREDALQFFEEKFPDSISLFGKENLLSAFNEWKAQGMISIKCEPLHYSNKCVLLGDAAHAMVPFYGQGMNCGMEDCLVFDELLDKYECNFDKVLPAFSSYRSPDAHAICDLAMYNYIEMRSSVNSKFFLLRRRLDKFLHWLLPNLWVPLYTTVSFTRRRYHECIENQQWQAKVLQQIMLTSLATSLLGLVLIGYKFAGYKIPFKLTLRRL